jgi:hypothetical protein
LCVCCTLEAGLLHADLEIEAVASLVYWRAGHLSLPVGFQSWTQEGNDEVRIDQAGVSRLFLPGSLLLFTSW